MPISASPADRPIVLVGMMGAGKSTVGLRLAARLGLPFADSDEEVERSTGLRTAELFERSGEAVFRIEERRALARLMEGPVRVIAAGGGAFVDPESRRLILQRGLAVWLDADPANLASRVAGSDRPLLKGVAGKALASLYAARRPIYAEAQVRVPSDGSVEEVIDAILAALSEPAR